MIIIEYVCVYVCVCGDNAITRVTSTHARARCAWLRAAKQWPIIKRSPLSITLAGRGLRRWRTRSERARTPVTKRAADRDTADGFGAVADYYRPVGREPYTASTIRRWRRRTRCAEYAPSTDGTGRIDR